MPLINKIKFCIILQRTLFQAWGLGCWKKIGHIIITVKVSINNLQEGEKKLFSCLETNKI